MDILAELLALKGMLFSTRKKAKDNGTSISELSAEVGNEELTTTAQTVKGAANELAASKANIAPGDEYTLTLINGWSGTVKYRLNSLGQVTIYGAVTVGTGSAHTIIGTLATGHISSDYVTFLCFQSTVGYAMFYVDPANGNIKVLANITGGTTVVFNNIFKAA